VRGGRTILDVLRAFPSIQMKPADLFDTLPPLQARYYSISSSSLVHPRRVAITANVVSYPVSADRVTATPGGSHPQRRGVCTHYLSQRAEGDLCLVFVKESLFRLPTDHSQPIVLIAAGSGVAPFRAFVQERTALRNKYLEWKAANPNYVPPPPAAPKVVASCSTPAPAPAKAEKHVASCADLDVPPSPVGDDVLYFGIRHPSVDFLYHDEVIASRNASTGQPSGFSLELATSHTQPWFVFVQHRLIEPEQAKRIWRLIHEENGFIYVCGDAKGMPSRSFPSLCCCSASHSPCGYICVQAWPKACTPLWCILSPLRAKCPLRTPRRTSPNSRL
jgi:NADPH-ferrihemoprotein reductase